MLERLNINKSKEFIIGEFPIDNLLEERSIGDFNLTEKGSNVIVDVRDSERELPHCHIVKKTKSGIEEICCICLYDNMYFQHTDHQKRVMSKLPNSHAEEKFFEFISTKIDKNDADTQKHVSNLLGKNFDINKIDTNYDLAREVWNMHNNKNIKKHLAKIPIPRYDLKIKNYKKESLEGVFD